MIKELLLVIVGAALANNLVLSGYFGFDSAVVGEKKNYALSTGLVLLVSAVVCSLLHGLLNANGLEYMEIMVFAIVILLASCLLSGPQVPTPFPEDLEPPRLGLWPLGSHQGAWLIESPTQGGCARRYLDKALSKRRATADAQCVPFCRILSLRSLGRRGDGVGESSGPGPVG